MFFNYRPNCEYIGQIRAERSVAQEMSLDSRARLLNNMENMLQFFHQGGNIRTVDDLKPTNGDYIEIIKMKMKNESQKILAALESNSTNNVSQVDPEERGKTIKDRKKYRYPCKVNLKRVRSKAYSKVHYTVLQEFYANFYSPLLFFCRFPKRNTPTSGGVRSAIAKHDGRSIRISSFASDRQGIRISG
jgi:hypothetical protein